MDMPVEAAASQGFDHHRHLPHSPRARYDTPRNDGDPTGPLATTSCEPRQAWKGAAAAADSGAGVWLVGSPPFATGEVSERLKEHAWKVCMG